MDLEVYLAVSLVLFVSFLIAVLPRLNLPFKSNKCVRDGGKTNAL